MSGLAGMLSIFNFRVLHFKMIRLFFNVSVPFYILSNNM